MKNYRSYVTFILSLLVFFVMYFTNYASSKIHVDEPNRLNDAWTYQTEVISLPTQLDIPKDTPLVIERILDEDFHEPKVLMLRTSLQDVRVFVEGELIYEKTFGETLDVPYASLWHFITLPRHIDGQTLSIELSSPYQAMSGQINEIFYGTHAAHYAYIVRTYAIRLIISVVVLMIGLLVLISHFFFAKKQDRGYAYAGLFAILLSLWMIAESKMLQFLTGSELLIGSLAYLVLPLFPIPLIDYLKEYVVKRNHKYFTLMKILFISQFVFLILSYLLGWYDFFETVTVSQSILVTAMLSAMFFLVYEVRKDKNEKAFHFLKALAVLSLFGILEIINFLVGDFNRTSMYLSFGLTLLIVILMVNYVRFLIGRLKLSYEKEVYEKLAYMDHVTQGMNRLAFERDLEIILADEKRKEDVRLIMFDLDGLKKINDAYGHLEGDRAIKKAFDIITETFGEQGACYRIGGDEFACLFECNEEHCYRDRSKFLMDKIQSFENETSYHFGLSFGSATLTQANMTPETLMHIADLDMYKHKNSNKKETLAKEVGKEIL